MYGWSNVRLVKCPVSLISQYPFKILYRKLQQTQSVRSCVCLGVHLSICQSITVFQSVSHLCVCLSVYLSVCLSTCPSIHLSVCLPACFSVCLTALRPHGLPTTLPPWLSACPHVLLNPSNPSL
jgi:hypothetical protein